MNKNERLKAITIIVILMASVSLSSHMLVNISHAEQKSNATIESSSAISYTINGWPRQLSAFSTHNTEQWEAIMSTGEEFFLKCDTASLIDLFFK